MNGTHVAGGSVGLVIGFIAARYGFHVSQDEAAGFGTAFAGVGATLAHVFTGPGLIPAVKRALFGPRTTPASK